MAGTHKVGGEVDALCTRCRLNLAHTILAMVGTKIARVRCNTCMGEHSYRGEQSPRPASTSASPPRPPRPEKVVLGFEQRLAGKDLADAKPYRPTETYVTDDVITHPTFGIGLVSAVRGDKVEVAFKAAVKTLIHGRAPAAPQRPEYTAPAAPSTAPSDKPGAVSEENH